MTTSTTAPPYDSTVEQLYHAANDVEMQDAFPTNKIYFYIVIDTNVLIDYCGIIEQFCFDVEKAGHPIMVVIPSVVLGELDGLKNRPELQWFARQATTWLLKKVKERTTVKLQSAKETLSPGARTESDEIRRNDLAIRDCCLYFADRSRGFGALLVTLDKNLNLECHKEDIDVCLPPQRSWSSRLLAKALPVAGVKVEIFQDREAFPRYRPSKTRQRLGHTEGPAALAPRLAIEDVDMMDVDDAAGPDASEEYVPLHARDSLHAQIAEHFTLVLRDLARRVHHECREPLTVSNSAHAPAYRRTALSSWTAAACFSYLETKKAFGREAWMPYFFARRGEHGWRKGQDWPPRMWNMALDMLEEVGRKFGDGALLSSVAAVRPHVQEVWEAKLRPI
ncbi:PIN domain-containing protein [Dichomitus squalens]|uniref:PIN domain-containing protein n=2 Tax=Dichomitus squalens TaxID=114155 RepID=A0A4Q9P5I6_9APHY|nr:uncharacterized protein DICSQDRAFT_136745 [Dichomitus squalens LYAD-421 SS1]EJF61181.1 hypothetical protein DICSQDRAFT_136745 [Dichomitus squalens LYAD-421 SS1]TBU49438.1 PIN domain-containing protein [Dichomitus squalens]TBU63961.1 PIN domain-containing protein [Dichomitus squalens]